MESIKQALRRCKATQQTIRYLLYCLTLHNLVTAYSIIPDTISDRLR